MEATTISATLESTTPSLINRFGGRKFLLASAVLASATGLVYGAHISDGVYSAVVIACVAAYITGNVVQKKIGGAA